MTPTECLRLALRTESKPPLSSDPDDARILHALTGMGTEVGEMLDACKKVIWYEHPMNVQNLVEESGDLLWYIGLLIDALHLDPEPLFAAQIDVQDTRPLLDRADPDADRALRHAFQIHQHVSWLLHAKGKDAVKEAFLFTATLRISAIVQNLKGLLLRYERTLDDAMNANIPKLEARYTKQQFDRVQALSRDLDREAVALAEGMLLK